MGSFSEYWRDMSNVLLTKFQRSRFEDFVLYIKDDWAVLDSEIALFESQLRSVFRIFLALACIATISGYGRRRQEYVLSVVDVAQLAIVHAAKGLDNTTNVLLRQGIELSLKHVYFLTHPVEYGWVNTRDDFKELGFQWLLDYTRKTEELRSFDQSELLFNRLTHYYAALSRYVHVHSGKFMGYRKTCRGNGKTVVEKLLDVCTGLWPTLITLLILFDVKPYVKASASEKKLIRSVLPKELRVAVDRYLREWPKATV